MKTELCAASRTTSGAELPAKLYYESRGASLLIRKLEGRQQKGHRPVGDALILINLVTVSPLAPASAIVAPVIPPAG